jgi:hypothetical protein
LLFSKKKKIHAIAFFLKEKYTQSRFLSPFPFTLAQCTGAISKITFASKKRKKLSEN